ncbi:MAG: hypothetical protein ACI9W6_002258 [Motiliproteus sp.]|jgi:hypothetical protein
MIDHRLLILIGLPLLLGMLALVATEQGLAPRPLQLWQRAGKAVCLHLGSWLLLFALLLALTQRPWFTMATVCGVQLFLVLVNNVKFDTLKEPFLLQDFEYFWDMLRHPRLYLPFFGIWRCLLSSLGALALVSSGLLLEPTLGSALESPVSGSFWIIIAALLLLALGLLRYGLRLPFANRFEPEADFKTLGQIAFFWIYARALRRAPAIDTRSSPFRLAAKAVVPQALPNLVVVQSESFFDPRPLSPLIKDSVLANYDRVKAQSLSHGRLSVPAWGANTVRTECGFLTGLPPAALGIHAFNPYRQLARQQVPNLAGYLRARGYRTLCIHPYSARFYLRDQVFPRLGFDQFIDITQFTAAQKKGQYTGDAAVAEKVSELLENAAAEPDSKPLFIFVITMENHGPLHLEKPDPGVVEQFCRQPLPPGCDDLAVYLGHIRSADRMLAQLTGTLSRNPREGVLCWYGDHLPIMPGVYPALQPVDGRTEYLIWRSGESGLKPQQQDLAVDQLAAQLLR